jgi:predicted oxidoreductase
MKMLKVNEKLSIPRIGLGCMRLSELSSKSDVGSLISEAMDCGINFFDHADIYGNGKSESLFGDSFDQSLRSRVIIQTKCAIRPGCCYDFSKQHILDSVDKSLKRLKTEYIDILLLHRPDTLMEPEEVAEAFDELEKCGKVRYFGVSNQNSFQIELLNHYCDNRVLIDQLQFSIAHCDIIDSGLNVNISNNEGCMRDGGILEYSRLRHITLQAWSPFQYGMFEGTFLGSEKYPELNKVLNRLSEKYGVAANAIAIAWILRHPAGIQAVVGTTNSKRLRDIAEADKICLTREEWYELYLSAGKKLP